MSQSCGFRWPGGKRAALSFSFDDARPSQLDVGMPILDAHGLKATFYVSLDNLGLRLGDWRAAVERGHEVGNHSLRHPCSGNFAFARENPLERYTPERMEQELLAANREIERLVGVWPITFAYPCGQTFVGRGAERRSYVPIVSRHFLVGRRAFDETHNHPLYCDLACANGMDADCAPFERIIGWVEAAVEDGGWLILVSHDVGEGGRQVTLARVLERLCAELATPDSPVWVDTVAEVGRYIKEHTEG